LIQRLICHKKSEHRVAYPLTRENAATILDFMDFRVEDTGEGRYARITDDGIVYGFHGSYEKSAKFGTILVVEDSHDWWHNYTVEEFYKKFDVVQG